jgi:hypothetical protein
MTSVADLHTDDYQEIIHLLVVEGWPYAYCDARMSLRDLIVGSSYLPDGVEVKDGLIPPQSIPFEVNPETGMLEERDIDFRIVDYDGTAAALFKSPADSELTQLGERIHPSTSGATLATIMKAGAQGGTVDVRGKHIGIEFIDSSGNRRARWVAPSDKPAGFDHPVLDLGNGDTETVDIEPVFISDDPVQNEGRYWALYTLVVDHYDGTLPSFADQYAGGSMLCYGRLLGDAEVDGNTWRLTSHGPASWYRKLLNAHRPDNYRSPLAVTSLSTEQGRDETGICVFLMDIAATPPNVDGMGQPNHAPFHAFDSQIWALNLSGLTDPFEIASRVATAISQTLAGTSTTTPDSFDGGSFGDRDGFDAWLSEDGSSVAIKVANQSYHANLAYYGLMNLIIHEKAWAAMGWDPRQSTLDTLDPRYVSVKKVPQTGIQLSGFDDPIIPPGPGYWMFQFKTWPPGYTLEDFPDKDSDNNGALRVYKHAFPNGTVFLSESGGIELKVGLDHWYIEGQRCIGPTAFTVGGRSADSVGWFLFEGEIQRGDEDKPHPYAQVALCDWNNDAGSIGLDSGNTYRTIRVRRWEDPRLFGLPFEKMTAPWIAPVAGDGAIRIRPMGVIGGYSPKSFDQSARVIPRMLIASGTSGAWTGEINPPTEGDNAPASIDYHSSDIEIQDLGCNINGVCLDTDSFLEEGAAIGWTDPLMKTKLGYVGGVQAETVLRGELSKCGWCLSWRKTASDKVPRFGVFTLFDHLGAADVEISLTTDDKAGDIEDPSSWMPRQRTRFEGPKDVFRVSCRWDPMKAGTRYEMSRPAKDWKRRGRPGNVPYEITSHGLADMSLWRAGEGMHWEETFRERFQGQCARWYAQGNFVIEETLAHNQGQYCGIGTVVRIVSDERPANPQGGYGLENFVGRVIAWEPVLTGSERGRFRVRILLQEKPLDASVFWDGSFYVDGFESSSSTIDCGNDKAGDWLGHGLDLSDVRVCEEPDWSSAGGTAKIEIWQSEDGGETWDAGDKVTADVVSVDLVNHRISLTNIVGTIYRAMDKVGWLQNADAHSSTAWPVSTYSIVTESDGDYGTGPTEGHKLQG